MCQKLVKNEEKSSLNLPLKVPKDPISVTRYFTISFAYKTYILYTHRYTFLQIEKSFSFLSKPKYYTICHLHLLIVYHIDEKKKKIHQ